MSSLIIFESAPIFDKRLSSFERVAYMIVRGHEGPITLTQLADWLKGTRDRAARAVERLIVLGHLPSDALERLADGVVGARQAVSDAIRQEIFERDGGRCIYCGSSDRLTLDHDLPVSRGGLSTLSNLDACCLTCNIVKGDRTGAEFEAERA